MKTYPKMNETVKDLLRRSNEPMSLYILTWLEELENRVQELTSPNDPLTLDELREMEGEPVYVTNGEGPAGYDGWQAYRRKPEEGET